MPPTNEPITSPEPDIDRDLTDPFPQSIADSPVASVHLERLPLTPNGKLDRGALPAPEDRAYLTRGYEAPIGEIETRLAGIRAEARAIPLRTGGAEPPLFLVHDGLGEIAYGSKLIPYLASGFPVYGLPSPGFQEEPLRTIQGMAAHMVRMIRAVQPDGAYRIAGWSFGATLAYEIATQLIGDDASVEFLGSIDGYYLGLGTKILQASPSVDGSELFRLPEMSAYEGAGFDALVRAYQEQSLIHAELSIEDGRRYLEPYRRHMLAAMTYVAHPIPIPLHLFVAEDTEDLWDAGELLNWKAVLPATRIQSITVPGTHYSMMEPPHLESLGMGLSQALHQAWEKKVVRPEKGYYPMLSIREAPGQVPPVLCVPGAGGTAISFLDLTDGLGDRGPIEALQPRGLDGTQVPYATVPAAARAYLQCVRKKYPDGSVHLLGHSFGGWIVFEMAQMLRAAGRPVASLTILDSEPPDSDGMLGREYSRTEAMMELINLYEQAAQRSLKITADQIDALDPMGQLALLSKHLARVGLISHKAQPADLVGMVRTFETSLRTRYRPQNAYPDPVRLALVSDPKKDRDANEESFESTAAGWRRWAPDLTIWHSPGNHMTMLRHPHVSSLANWLSLVLQPAEI